MSVLGKAAQLAKQPAHVARRLDCRQMHTSLIQHQKDRIVLGVMPGCTQGDLKQAYRSRAWIVHPDGKQTAEERRAAVRAFQDLSAAYERLRRGADPYTTSRTGTHSYYRSCFVEFLGVSRREFEDTWAHVVRSLFTCRRAPTLGFECGRRRH